MTNGMRGQVIWDGYEMYIGFESNWEFNTLLNPDQVVCGGAE